MDQAPALFRARIVGHSCHLSNSGPPPCSAVFLTQSSNRIRIVAHFLRVEVAVQTEGRDTHSSSRGPSISEGPATISSPLRSTGSLPSPSIPSLFSQQPFCRARVCLPPQSPPLPGRKAPPGTLRHRGNPIAENFATFHNPITTLSHRKRRIPDSGREWGRGVRTVRRCRWPAPRSVVFPQSRTACPTTPLCGRPAAPRDPQTVYPPPSPRLGRPPPCSTPISQVFPASNRSPSTPQGPHVTRWGFTFTLASMSSCFGSHAAGKSISPQIILKTSVCALISLFPSSPQCLETVPSSCADTTKHRTLFFLK